MNIGASKAKRVDANYATLHWDGLGHYLDSAILQSRDVWVWVFVVKIRSPYPMLQGQNDL